MRRWQRILLVSACAVAGFFCAWLLRDVLMAKPIVARLPDGTTLSFYAMTHGTNQAQFPEPNPFKRWWANIRSHTPWPTGNHSTASRFYDEETAFWWFKANKPVQPASGSVGWHAMVHAPHHPGGRFGMMTRAWPTALVGFDLVDCPTNEPNIYITFVSYKQRTSPDERFKPEVITNLTVPNPMYKK